MIKAATQYFADKRNSAIEGLSSENRERIIEAEIEIEKISEEQDEYFTAKISEGMRPAEVVRTREFAEMSERQDELRSEIGDVAPSESEVLAQMLADTVKDLREESEYPFASYTISLTPTGVNWKVGKLGGGWGSVAISGDGTEFASEKNLQVLVTALCETHSDLFPLERVKYSEGERVTTDGDGNETVSYTQKMNSKKSKIVDVMRILAEHHNWTNTVLSRGGNEKILMHRENGKETVTVC